jgi:hypothetical protein
MIDIKDFILQLEDTTLSLEEQQAALLMIEQSLIENKQIQEKTLEENSDLIVEAVRAVEEKLDAKFTSLKTDPKLKGPKGDQGISGINGKEGRDGVNGKDGIKGQDGADGIDGKDGRYVTNVEVDLDDTLLVTLSDGTQIKTTKEIKGPKGDQGPQGLRGSPGAGIISGGASGQVLAKASNGDYDVQWTNPSSSIDLSSPPTIGNTAPNTGKFTTLEATGNVDLGTGSANYVDVAGGAATIPPVISSMGSDTNISLVLDPKGTGAVNIASGSKGVNLSNGTTVTAITRTNSGSGYTSLPTIVVAPPQTTGGVQAVITGTLTGRSQSVDNGGTGYTVGDILTLVGGTGTAATYTVSTVSSGVVTAISFTSGGAYTTIPTNPVSTTGGTGTGATLTIGFGVNTVFTITNAGLGYVEQPAITFSGGGGTGATAYASVGAGTVFRSLGSTGTQSIDFATPNYITNNIPALRLRDIANADSYPLFANAAGSTNITVGGLTTANLLLGAGTTGQRIDFQTQSATQFRVLNSAASAVNLLQVTGGATGIAPYMSAQGTDTDIPMVLQPKGTGALQAQLTTSTATGGNARGANAVDWQTIRGVASQVASASYSVIGGGSGNTTSGSYSISGGGLANVLSGSFSVLTGGRDNVTSGQYAFVGGGRTNTAGGYFNTIVGGAINSGTANAAVTTQATTTVTSGSTAVTLSGSNANIKVGQLITGTGIQVDPATYVAAISGTSLTLSTNATATGTPTLTFFTPHGVVVGGGNNQATGSYSFIGGGGDAGTAANRNVASGDWGTVGGGFKNTASGLLSTVLGGTSNTASGVSSVVCGGGSFGNITQLSGNTASGLASFVGAGFSNTSSSNATFVGAGASNTANGLYASVLAGSNGTTRSIWGNHVLPSLNPFSTPQGSCQSATLVLGKQTTDATATVLTCDGSAGGTVNQVIMPNNSAYYFKGSVIANVTGAANGASWSFEGSIMRGANAASTVLIGTPVLNRVGATAGATAWNIALTADTTNGGLAVTVTGVAATTIRWVAKLETTEVTY